MNPDSTLWAKRMNQSFENAGERSASQAQTALGTIAAMKGTAIKHKRPILETELPLDGSGFEELVSRSPVFAIRPRPRRVFRPEEYEISEIITRKDDPRNRLRQRTHFLNAIRDRQLSDGEIVRAAIAEKKNILAAGYAKRLFGILALIEFAWTGSADTLALLQAMHASNGAASVPVGNATASVPGLARGLFGGTNAVCSPSEEYQLQNMQDQKEGFLAAARKKAIEDYLATIRVVPINQFVIRAGWDIPAILEQGINSDLPGEIRALVRENVYDTASGQHLLIPQGSRLVGRYSSQVAYGQNGLQVVWDVVWDKVIFLDASSIDLSGMNGQDANGWSGFRYGVDDSSTTGEDSRWAFSGKSAKCREYLLWAQRFTFTRRSLIGHKPPGDP